MTYEEIITALRQGKCDATADALDRAAYEEARALARTDTRPSEVSGSAARRALPAAEEFYAEDITAQLREPEQPTPNRMLNLRRFPVAWAVAEVLRTNKLGGAS